MVQLLLTPAALALAACTGFAELDRQPPDAIYDVPDSIGVYGFNAYAEGLGHDWCARVQNGPVLEAWCYD